MPDRLGDAAAAGGLRRARPGRPRSTTARGPLHALVEQGFEPDGVAGAGLEGPAVFAEHRAEGDVHEIDVAEPHSAGRLEELLEVPALPVIDDVEDPSGRQCSSRHRIVARSVVA